MRLSYASKPSSSVSLRPSVMLQGDERGDSSMGRDLGVIQPRDGLLASTASVVTVPLGAAADLVEQEQTTTELTGGLVRSAALTLPAS
jgi:hypothetical protein